MAHEPGGPSQTESETTVDRFEHEIEDLEQTRTLRQVILYSGVGVIVATAIVGAFLIGSKLQELKSDGSRQAIVSIDTFEPKPTSLPEKPAVFRWESILGATSYVVRIQEEGQTTDLIARETNSNWLQLTPDEQAHLIMGGRYTWSVRARGKEGWPIGEGGSRFSL